MEAVVGQQKTRRYGDVSEKKSDGATFTPKILADFVAHQIILSAQKRLSSLKKITILDPAIGDGELVVRLVEQLRDKYPSKPISVKAFETNPESVFVSTRRLAHFSKIDISIINENFLDYAALNGVSSHHSDLFVDSLEHKYDLIIANPPYVRTQILGATEAQLISDQFGLSGRIDLYYAFIFGMAQVLDTNGTAGMIVSNRFMSTKSGGPVRKGILENFCLQAVWDLGDTKIFDTAVLPAVLLAKGKSEIVANPLCSSIYESSSQAAENKAPNVIGALGLEGLTKIEDGRVFEVKKGVIKKTNSSSDVWRLANDNVESWLNMVAKHTWAKFGDIGKIRVGVKTTADKVFIIKDESIFDKKNKPECLTPLTTHHMANRFRAKSDNKSQQHIIYTHEIVDGKRKAISLDEHPNTKSYLEKHRSALEARKYVIEAGRNWYEIWVPQNPDFWRKTKLVFRDISAKPTFWIDKTGSVVNGDCYWMIANAGYSGDTLWLALAVANSSFIEKFYDLCFPNKLYAGRRRFITQYVEKFPLPDPQRLEAKSIIDKAKEIYEISLFEDTAKLQKELDTLVWSVFGLVAKEV